MKFSTIASLALLAASASAQRNCGSQCDASKTPTSVISGPIKVVEVKYKVGGTVVVENDCVFKTVDFFLDPAPERPVSWHCKGANNDGIWISKAQVQATNPNAPQTYSFDVTDTDPFCHGALISDCQEYILIEEDTYRTIAQAKVTNGGAAPAPSTSGSPSAGKPSSGTSGNIGNANSGSSATTTVGSGTKTTGTTKQTATTSDSKTSDATTSKWSMALIGLSSLAAFLLA